MSLRDTTDKVFRAIEKGAQLGAPLLETANPIVAGVLEGVGIGAGLIADLLEMRQDPAKAITRIRSALPDLVHEQDRLEAYARDPGAP